MISPIPSPQGSDELSELLQCWRVETTSSVAFNRNVWHQIEAAECRDIESFSLFGKLFLAWLQKLTSPRIAASAAAIALFSGVLLGGLQARNSQEEQYLLSLNPYHASSAYHTLH